LSPFAVSLVGFVQVICSEFATIQCEVVCAENLSSTTVGTREIIFNNNTKNGRKYELYAPEKLDYMITRLKLTYKVTLILLGATVRCPRPPVCEKLTTLSYTRPVIYEMSTRCSASLPSGTIVAVGTPYTQYRHGIMSPDQLLVITYSAALSRLRMPRTRYAQ